MNDADAEIRERLANRQSFVLDAGAGAGKTYSLVQALRYLLGSQRKVLERAGQRIACVTFTNVAKDEILERIGHDPLVWVSTIHDFLWELIQPHQRALRAAVLKFNASLPAESARRKDQDELEAILPTLAITYADTGSNLLKGRLYHDDLLSVARIMFADNPMLSRLTAARFPVLFVDEYQDTSPAVVELILALLLPRSGGDLIVGFFGDKLQNIYHGGGEHSGVGELPPALAEKLMPIVKEENHRCSEAVIAVLNRIRTDIEQYPAANNAKGAAVYVHPGAAGAAGFAKAQAQVAALGWILDEADTKELYLTHRLISRKAGYDALLTIYTARRGFHRDRLVSGEDETIAFFLEKVEPLAAAWADQAQGSTLTLLRRNGYRLNSNAGERAAKESLDRLNTLRAAATVGEVLTHIRDARLFPLPDELAFRLSRGKREANGLTPEALEAEARDVAFYKGLFALPYGEVRAYAVFYQAHTPYATKHGVKGAEFDTVIVVLDDEGANWNLYSFSKYLSGEDLTRNEARWKRTRNVFYVCCSRPKRNLAVIDLAPRSAAKDARARELFGEAYAHFL